MPAESSATLEHRPEHAVAEEGPQQHREEVRPGPEADVQRQEGARELGEVLPDAQADLTSEDGEGGLFGNVVGYGRRGHSPNRQILEVGRRSGANWKVRAADGRMRAAVGTLPQRTMRRSRPSDLEGQTQSGISVSDASGDESGKIGPAAGSPPALRSAPNPVRFQRGSRQTQNPTTKKTFDRFVARVQLAEEKYVVLGNAEDTAKTRPSNTLTPPRPST